MFCDIEGWMRMGYFLHLRAAIHQGTDTRLLKKKLTMCVCVFVLLYCLNASKCVCVCARQNIILCYFSSPLDFPALWRKLYFRKHSLEISRLLGENLSRSLVPCTEMNLAVTQQREFRFPLCLCLRCSPHLCDGPR